MDGDTIIVQFQGKTETLRILGVDTPEISKENTPYEYKTNNLECVREWGYKAKDFTYSMLKGKYVQIEFDEKAGLKDSFGRLLAYVYIDGKDFGKMLIEKGYARVYVEGEFSKESEYIKAEKNAINVSAGLWECKTELNDTNLNNAKLYLTQSSTRVIYVPDSYPTIQKAVEYADPGDTIIVKPGIYYEKPIEITKPLTIKSEKGADYTTVKPIAEDYKAVFIISSSYVTIEGFRIEGSVKNTSQIGIIVEDEKMYKAGIYLSKLTSNCEISENVIVNHNYGIMSIGSADNLIKDNIIINNSDGIFLRSFDPAKTTYLHTYMTNTTITNNKVLYNDIGIILIVADKNLIESNEIFGNKYGIQLAGSNKNTIKNNEISANTYGIYLYAWKIHFEKPIKTFKVSYNEIYLNDFIANELHAFSSESTSLWNSPHPVTYTYNGKVYKNYIGNYWDSYQGYDRNKDGIGDYPYIISGEEGDKYPLMEKSSNYEFTAIYSKETKITDILLNPDAYHRKIVELEGFVTNLKLKISKKGNPYTIFDLEDETGNKIRVFSWGHLKISEGEKVRVKGTFYKEKWVGQYVFYNEIDAQVVIPIEKEIVQTPTSPTPTPATPQTTQTETTPSTPGFEAILTAIIILLILVTKRY